MAIFHSSDLTLAFSLKHWIPRNICSRRFSVNVLTEELINIDEDIPYKSNRKVGFSHQLQTIQMITNTHKHVDNSNNLSISSGQLAIADKEAFTQCVKSKQKLASRPGGDSLAGIPSVP